MTVELWMSQEFDTSHERSALDQFVDNMKRKFGESEQLHLILANYYLGGRQIDLTILKSDAIIVIELKEWNEAFHAVENGDWLTIPDRKKLSSADQNPFGQVKDYRFKWMDLLKAKKGEFLPLAKADSMNFSHISAFIAIRPKIHQDAKNDIPNHLPWFRLVSFEDLSLAISQQTSLNLNFSENELRVLVSDVLNLKKIDHESDDTLEPVQGDEVLINIQTEVDPKSRTIFS